MKFKATFNRSGRPFVIEAGNSIDATSAARVWFKQMYGVSPYKIVLEQIK